MNYTRTNSETSIGQPILFGQPKQMSGEDFRIITILGNPSLGIKDQSFEIYKSLFENKLREGESIVRIWNYIPNINSMKNADTDFYMSFNSGRYTAWQRYGKTKKLKPYCPAATAIGATSGPILVQAMVSTNKVFYLKNKRQTPFVDYGKKYGGKPPCSSRLTVEDCGAYWRLWVAGTSAVVGQEIIGNNLSEQCRVTWENLESLLINNIELQNLGVPSFDIKRPENLKCYLRDINSVKNYHNLIREFFDIEPIIHLADICRGSFTGILYHEVECGYVVKKE